MQTFTKQSTIPCRSCGEPFVPGSLQALYCSLTCKERAKRHRRADRNRPIYLPSPLKKTGPYFAILTSPTLQELKITCEAYMLHNDPKQSIYVEDKPKGFKLPPGLRDSEYDNIYKIGFK
jgi:hypothetical protein